jgi:hypothetical protein
MKSRSSFACGLAATVPDWRCASGGKTVPEIRQRPGDRLQVLAGMLDVVADRLAIGTEINHDIVACDPVFDRRPGLQLDKRLSVAGS